MASVTGTNGAGSGLTAPAGFGVLGNSDSGDGVVALSGTGIGLLAISKGGDSGFFESVSGGGLTSIVNAANEAAVSGIADAQQGTGVHGYGNTGVYGSSDLGAGVFGDTSAASAGVHGKTYGEWGAGVIGETTGNGYAIWGLSQNSYAGLFEGNVLMGGHVYIYGSLLKPGGSFRIDHPLDPANKYLSHSFVESPDMMNVYNGNVVLNEQGAAMVHLPEWFDVLNRDFRYQLTSIGAPAPGLHISSEIDRRYFRIAGGAANGKVSWQVTGIRQDKWANANRVQVEEEKPAKDRGYYLHPGLYGEPEDKTVMPGPRPKRTHTADVGPVKRIKRPKRS
jgi:hypothetical protein